MSVKRYGFPMCECDATDEAWLSDFGMAELKDGGFVRWEDYAALLATNERVCQRFAKTQIEANESEAENARLKAELERLRKAGDAMQKRLYVLENPTHPEVYLKLLSAWNAAKEGKQP